MIISASEKTTGSADTQIENSEVCSDEDDKDTSIYEQKVDKRRRQSNIPEIPESFMNFKRYICIVFVRVDWLIQCMMLKKNVS